MLRVANSIWVALVILALSFSSGGAQEQKDQPNVTVFEDWGHVCEKVPGGDQELCYVFQRLRQKESEKVVMNTTVAINPNDKKAVISVLLPLGMLLPPGVQMKVDDTEEVLKAPYVICVQGGCRASSPLSESMLKGLKEGKQLVVAFVAGNRKAAKVPVSLKGFPEAFDKLQ